MNSILIEMRALFRKERVYLFLLVFIVVFYLVVFLAHQMAKESGQGDQNPPSKIERLLRDAPQNPEVIQKRLSERPGLFWLVQLFTLFFICAFAWGVWLGSSGLRRWIFLKQELISASNRSLHISWGITEVVKVIILFFSGGILLNIILIFLKLGLGYRLDSSALMIVHTLLLDIAAVFFIVSTIQKSGARAFDLGFNFEEVDWREIWLGIRTYLIILPFFIVILAALVYLANRLAYEPPPHPLAEMLLQDESLSPWMILVSLLVACVIGPIVEEIFFRGFFYPALRKYWGIGSTSVVTAALFAGVHENIFSFFPIFFLGLVLCYLYEKRSSLISCISLHMVHNTTFIMYFFLMKSILLGGKGGP